MLGLAHLATRTFAIMAAVSALCLGPVLGEVYRPRQMHGRPPQPGSVCSMRATQSSRGASAGEMAVCQWRPYVDYQPQRTPPRIEHKRCLCAQAHLERYNVRFSCQALTAATMVRYSNGTTHELSVVVACIPVYAPRSVVQSAHANSGYLPEQINT